MTLRARLARLEGRTPAPDTAPALAVVEYLDGLAARKATGDASVQSELNEMLATLKGL